jgi:hypothetical protein
VASLTEVVEIVTFFSMAGSGCWDFGVISIAWYYLISEGL